VQGGRSGTHRDAGREAQQAADLGLEGGYLGPLSQGATSHHAGHGPHV